METHAVVLLIVTTRLFCLGTDAKTCISPQHLELGKLQVIQCHFQDGFYAVAWYDSDEVTQNNLLIRQINGLKQGIGYSSGEFDIQMDGSLVIRNVTLQHDHKFTIWVFRSQDDDPVSLVVKVIVTVKPLVNFPVIDLCEEKPLCLTQIIPGSNVTCFFRDVRPAVSLSWVARTADGDMEVSFDTSVIDNNVTYTSRATISSAFLHLSLLSLLVCKANVSTWTFLQHESLIFVENGNINLTNMEPVTRYVERNSQLKLSCSEKESSLVVWKYSEHHGGVFRIISYAATFEANVSKIYLEDYQLQSEGSLKVAQTQTRHDGLYGCVFENKDANGMALYNVIVFVAAYPVVHGCTLNQYCVLSIQFQGSLTCSVTGIRPKVQLEWRTLDETDSSLIVFSDQEITTSTNGDTYDVRITSKYKIQQTSRNRLTLECRILKPNITAFSPTAKFDVLIKNGQPIVTLPNLILTTEDAVAVKHSYLWMLTILILPFLLTCVIYRRFQKDSHLKKHQTMQNTSENTPMILDGIHIGPAETNGMESSSDKKKLFILELKAKYGNLFSAIQPIPFIRDKLYCVHELFVEGGIEYLVENVGKLTNWKKLDSYQPILNDPSLKSMRCILEGEPGYGKSTLTLQLAYEWCNNISDTYMKDTDILILIRLRQYRADMSIFTAIKQFSLPKDTELTEKDIRDIIYSSSSVVVVLDGFDEYPDRDRDTTSDVFNIITREMFQHVKVILTTRSSCLPNKYPALTRRIKLTGFGDAAQDEYIQKAVVGDCTDASKKIKQRLKENPILECLCQVPLFFAMFAHMSLEFESFRQCNSVTRFFQYMISCFHSHMKNKMKDTNVTHCDLYETDHKKLDKVAYEGLSSRDQHIHWSKEDLLGRLGENLYYRYVGIGILVEEEVLDISLCLPFAEHIQYKTEVRFFHKLFCEWYAAHHLAECVSRKDMTLENSKSNVSKQGTKINVNGHCFKHLDPFDLQYLYRFACGLSPTASKAIVGYLKNKKDTHRLAILCILEQREHVESGLKDVESLCSRDVVLSPDDSMFFQMSTILLLKTASANQIAISSMHLANCYKNFDLSIGHIQMKSTSTIPVLTTLKKLWIEEKGNEISSDNINGIFKYSSMCSSLKELWFYRCLLPRFIGADSLINIRTRDLQVFWGTGSKANYSLNLETGKWQRPPTFGSTVMTDEDYQQAKENVKLQKKEKLS